MLDGVKTGDLADRQRTVFALASSGDAGADARHRSLAASGAVAQGARLVDARLRLPQIQVLL